MLCVRYLTYAPACSTWQMPEYLPSFPVFLPVVYVAACVTR
ncbi:hypothetical protein D805_0898 [Bifidobacterium thermophilum RBL67]|uniref:Uncharacterized protein n=1 Tax=Bifidobacterium thermophilum RBL67 TaxID=1254439 RepID=M4RCG7_9BIFI|nr:hypothetical protein D805_0898 [Bifidobacterium thermophilum RBL67]